MKEVDLTQSMLVLFNIKLVMSWQCIVPRCDGDSPYQSSHGYFQFTSVSRRFGWAFIDNLTWLLDLIIIWEVYQCNCKMLLVTGIRYRGCTSNRQRALGTVALIFAHRIPGKENLRHHGTAVLFKAFGGRDTAFGRGLSNWGDTQGNAHYLQFYYVLSPFLEQTCESVPTSRQACLNLQNLAGFPASCPISVTSVVAWLLLNRPLFEITLSF